MAEHGRALLAYAVRLCGDRHAAEDVVQEVLVRAWQRAGQLTEAHGSVRGWLLTVTRNLVIDQARARAARPREVADLEGAGEAAGAVTDHAGAVVDSITVVGMLDTLSPEHREVLVELYYRDRSTAQAAEVLGVPSGTVKSRAYYALRALRQSAQQRRTGPLAHGGLS
jgi:RNA polymerase sigma-70 factor (ECF subfamily)